MRKQSRQVRERIGLVAQNVAVDEILGGRQNLVMFGRLYGLNSTDARARADDLPGTFGLTDAVCTYSGGMRRTLELIAVLLPLSARAYRKLRR